MLLQRTRAATARALQQQRLPLPNQPFGHTNQFANKSHTDKMDPYTTTIHAITSACKEMNLSFMQTGGHATDGRITSAVREKDYLDQLEARMRAKDPDVLFERPPDRFWYDVRINRIPINLKLTAGGTDNVFNKKSIIFTLTADESAMGNMNFSEWYRKILAGSIKPVRDRMTEYHFLVVNKETSEVLLKSILDIHTYKSNPCNDLQINWKHEFKNAAYYTPDAAYEQKVKELLKTLQASVKQYLNSIIEFANANIDEDMRFM